MNKGNYEEIARIIKNSHIPGEPGTLDSYLIKELADYFDSLIPNCDNKKKHCSCLWLLHNKCCICGKYIFNKKQFLKDAGVK